MIILLGIIIVCCFITIWCFILAADSGSMSFKEYFTGKDISKSWQDDIMQLQKDMKKQEERITKLETYIYIADVKCEERI